MNVRLCTALSALMAIAAVSAAAQSVEQGVALYEAKKAAEAKAMLLPFGQRDPVAAYHLGRIMMEEMRTVRQSSGSRDR